MDVLLAAWIVFVAANAQGGLGFGFGLVCMTLLPLVIDMQTAVPVVSVFGLPLSLALAWRLRADLSLSRLGPLAGGGLLGVPLGVAFLKGADPTVLKGTLGATLIVFAFWIGRSGAVRPRPGWLGGVAGFAGGILAGAFSTGGPPAVAYASSTPWTPSQIRATLQGYFALLSTLHIALLAQVGLVNSETLTFNALLLPPLFVGAVSGDRLSRRLSPERFRLLIRGGMVVVGLSMLHGALGG